MKTTYPPTYLWLLIGLFFSTAQASAQNMETYQKLGWAERSMTITVLANELQRGSGLTSPSSAVMLNANTSAKEGVDKFQGKYPGRGSVLFTNELLRDFENTENQAEGFHLFIGKEYNRLIPIIVHTDINRENNPGWTTNNKEPGYYRSKFRQAYFWNYRTKRWTVVKQFPQLLKRRIERYTKAFDMKRKGFFLAKGALLTAWKRSGQQPLTLYFTIQQQELHLFLPYCLTEELDKVASAGGRTGGQVKLPVQYFYTVAVTQQAVAGGSNGQPTPASPTSGSGPFYKAHGSVRCCPSYCGGVDVE